MRPSRIVQRSTPSTCIVRLVGAKPGGSSGPVFVPRMFHAHNTVSPVAATTGGSGSPKRRSGNARKLSRMNCWTAGTPRAGSGRAGSAHTMSSVTSSAIAAVSHPFQAAT